MLERVKFAGIMGMLYDEFAMKRMGGLKRKIQKGKNKPSRDGLSPDQQLKACRAELEAQSALVSKLVQKKLRALQTLGDPYSDEDIAAAPAAVEGKTEMDAVIAYLQGLGLARSGR